MRQRFLDLSFYQGDIYAERIAEDFAGVVLRVSIGASGKDQRWEQYYQQCEHENLLIAGYFVVNPFFSPEAIYGNFERCLGGRPIVFASPDVELTGGLQGKALALRVRDTLALCAQKHRTIPYTGRWWLERYMGAQSWYDQYEWWLAGYPYDGGAVPHWLPETMAFPTHYIPQGISLSKVAAWQWTSKLPNAQEYVSSRGLDANTSLQPKPLFGKPQPPPLFPEPEPLPKPQPEALMRTLESVRMRAWTSTAAPIVGGYAAGVGLYAYETKLVPNAGGEHDLWVRVQPEGWVACRYWDGRRTLELVEMIRIYL